MKEYVAVKKKSVESINFIFKKEELLKMKIKKDYFYIIGTLVAIAIGIFLIRPYTETDDFSEDDIKNLAQCLGENGVTMYGSRYCSHCQKQKEMFGESFSLINYVECTTQGTLCARKNVPAYPSWEIKGRIMVGEKTFEELSTLSGCPLN